MDFRKQAKSYLDRYFKSQYINESDAEFKALVRLLKKAADVDNFQIDSVDRYYYASGRNYWTYREVTHLFGVNSGARKETVREVTICTGEEWNLPDWAKGITSRKKHLESNFF